MIGSSLQYEFQQTSDGSVLVRQPELVSFDDREMKPVNIQLHIGRRPILAVGNSDGDLAMFQYTGGRSSSSEAGKVPFLNLLVVHGQAGAVVLPQQDLVEDLHALAADPRHRQLRA